MSSFEKSSDYFYENTKILVNNLNIRDKEKLHNVERKLTSLRLSELHSNPLKGKFDFEYLKSINKYLFQDLYPWAGEIRKSELAKLDLFCLYNNIEIFAKSIFDELAQENYYINYSIDDKIVKLVNLFGNINALHPFREGNGRTQRLFIENLANINGIDLDLTRISQEYMIAASHLSMNGDNKLLMELFDENYKVMSSEMQLFNIVRYCDEGLSKKLCDAVLKNNNRVR